MPSRASWGFSGNRSSTASRPDLARRGSRRHGPRWRARSSGRGQARTKTETTTEDRGRVPRGDPASPARDEGKHRGPAEGGTEIRTGPSETRGKDRTGPAEDQGPHEPGVGIQRVIPRRL